MIKTNKNIEIVASTNPRLNAMTREAQLTIRDALDKVYTNVGITIVNNMADLRSLIAKKPDLVVLGMKLVLLDEKKGYDNSPKVWLSAYLTVNGIEHTGSETFALEQEYDKHIAKQVVIDAGLKSAKYFISTINKPKFTHSLDYPLFVKPTNRGDSKGIDEYSVVHTSKQLKEKILYIHNTCDSDALIEEYLTGREFSVAVIEGSFPAKHSALPIEITTPMDKNGNSFLSEEVKVADNEVVLAITDKKIRKAVNTLAIGVFKALGSRDYGRIDMRTNHRGVPYFIEANLMPGLSDHGYLMSCFELNRQTSYDEMILSIVDKAVQRTERILQTNLADALSNINDTTREVNIEPVLL